MTFPLPPNHFYYLGEGLDPSLELWIDDAVQQSLALAWVGDGRHGEESLWLADLSGLELSSGAPAQPEWQFRLNLGDGRLLHPEYAPVFTTTLRSLWMQDGQLFDYRPAPAVSPPSVVKFEEFHSSLGKRPLYIYLPRGYDQHEEKRYPVLYMHDGQNCFDAFVDDSYAGAWQADLAASLLIRQGLMQECLIVGVSNGEEQRILEYLPPLRAPSAAAAPAHGRHGSPAATTPPLDARARARRSHVGHVPGRSGALAGRALPRAAGPRAHGYLRLVAGRALFDLHRLGTHQLCAASCGAVQFLLGDPQPRRQAGSGGAHAQRRAPGHSPVAGQRHLQLAESRPRRPA
jgi:hypothetical protein